MMAKLEGGQYSAWEKFWDDCVVMFQNAMTYNSNTTIFHQEVCRIPALHRASSLRSICLSSCLLTCSIPLFQAKHLLWMTGKLVQEASNNAIKMDGSLYDDSNPMERNLDMATTSAAHHQQYQRPRTLSGNNASGSAASLGDYQEASHHAQGSVSSLFAATSHQSQAAASTSSGASKPNIVGAAQARRSTYQPLKHEKPFGLLQNLRNGSGSPFSNAAMHLKMKPLNIEKYIHSLKRFARPLHPALKSYLFRRAAERISPGSSQRQTTANKASNDEQKPKPG